MSQQVFELSLHPYGQLQLFNEFYFNNKNIIFCSGRGSGKSIVGRAGVALSAVDYKGSFNRDTSYYNVIAAPYLNQAVRVHWDPLVRLFTDTPLKHFVKPRGINKTDHKIELIGNRPSIILVGLNEDGGDKVRGSSIPTLLIDEFQDVDNNKWEAALEPCVSRADGKFIITGTPKGKGSFFHKYVEERKKLHNWVFKSINTIDNLTIPNIKRIVAEAQQRLPSRVFQQEYYASWELFPGQIFDHLDEVEHIREVSTNPNDYDSCYLGIDYGDYHPAVVVVGQKGYPATYTIIDSWAPDTGMTIPFEEHKAKALEFALKYNVYSTFPDLYTPLNRNCIHELIQLPHPGLKNIDVAAPKLDVMESCGTINRLFKQNRLYINKNLTQLCERFQAYHRKTDRFGNVTDKEDPTFPTHEIDSVRYVLGRVEPAITITLGYTQALYR